MTWLRFTDLKGSPIYLHLESGVVLSPDPSRGGTRITRPQYLAIAEKPEDAMAAIDKAKS